MRSAKKRLPPIIQTSIGSTSSAKPARKLKHKLADLMAQCDPNAPLSDDLKAWDEMPSVGLELVDEPEDGPH